MLTQELIEAAFADVPYPGDDHIADHQDCLECDEVRAFFRGKSWRDLKFPELWPYHGSLPLLTVPAFHYFLPGYMLASLNANGHELGMIPYGVLNLGCYPKEVDAASEKYAADHLYLFTRAQREVVAEYLRFIKVSGPSELQGDADIDYSIEKILRD